MRRAAAIGLALLGLAGAAFAQAPAASAPANAGAADAPFVLREIRLPRTVAVPEEQVFAVLAPSLRRAVGPAERAAMVSKVKRLYESLGFGLADIAEGALDVESGAFEIHIVEPTIGQVVIEMGATPPISAERARRVFENLGLVPGAPLNTQRLDRAMFVLNDWPGVTARAVLTPVPEGGQHNVLVGVDAGSRLDGTIDYDNHGSESSGRHRLGGLLRWNNPLGLGDNLDLRALVSSSQRVTVGRLGYELPLGATPWRAGAAYSRVTYELGGSFELLGAVGSADIVDVSLSYPLIRERERNLTARVALENKRLEDRFDAVNVASNKHIDDVQIALSFEDRDRFWGGGYNGAGLGLQFGRLAIATADVNTNDAVLGNRATQGNFAKINAQVTRLQAITPTVHAFVGLAGQWASKNLDNAEKLTLGGAKGVRSYPGGEAPADQGLVVNAELRWWIDPSWTAFGFYDWGYGGLQKRPLPGNDNKRILTGAGLGLQFTRPEIVSFKASLGWRGAEPVLSEPGNDRVRFLIQAQRPF